MKITNVHLITFRRKMIESEMADGTVERYMGIISQFSSWLGNRDISKDILLEWRKTLDFSPATINVAVSAINKMLDILELGQLKLKQVRVQKSIYCSEEKELSITEYERLVQTAEKEGKLRLARALETICALGIRVSELQYVTVETLASGKITINNKGRIRTILIQNKLSRKLRDYCRKIGLVCGPIFITRTGKTLGRKQLWAEMKSICELAGVLVGKVFPHNLRHLFAVTHYKMHKDIVRLADLLGHSSVNTTRIYLKTSGAEQRRELEMLGLTLSDKLLASLG